MRPILLLFLASACAEAPAATSVPAGRASSLVDVAKPAPTVVLVSIDTLRADALAPYGGTAVDPTLADLAARGARFRRCVSASMLTNPSHTSLMTSLYPRDHGVYDNESGVRDGMRSIAAALHERGFRTAAVVNFPHLNPNVANLAGGFDTFVPAGPEERPAVETSRLALAALDAVKPSEPFFLWAHYTDPHAPYVGDASNGGHDDNAPRAGPRTSLAAAAKVAPGFQRHNPWFKKIFASGSSLEELRRDYIQEISRSDAGLGVLLAGIAARGRQPIVVVISDHGENLGERQLYFHHGGLYAASTHVPLIIAGPGIPAVVVDSLVSSVDVAPTILDLMHVPRFEPMRGQSLVPTFTSPSAVVRRFAFSEHMGATLVAVRNDRALLIEHRSNNRQFPSYPMTTGRRELYRLDADLNELPGAVSPEDIQDLGDALGDYLGVGPQASAQRSRHSDRESLRALGYVE